VGIAPSRVRDGALQQHSIVLGKSEIATSGLGAKAMTQNMKRGTRAEWRAEELRLNQAITDYRPEALRETARDRKYLRDLHRAREIAIEAQRKVA